MSGKGQGPSEPGAGVRIPALAEELRVLAEQDQRVFGLRRGLSLVALAALEAERATPSADASEADLQLARELYARAGQIVEMAVRLEQGASGEVLTSRMGKPTGTVGEWARDCIRALTAVEQGREEINALETAVGFRSVVQAIFAEAKRARRQLEARLRQQGDRLAAPAASRILAAAAVEAIEATTRRYGIVLDEQCRASIRSEVANLLELRNAEPWRAAITVARLVMHGRFTDNAIEEATRKSGITPRLEERLQLLSSTWKADRDKDTPPPREGAAAAAVAVFNEAIHRLSP